MNAKGRKHYWNNPVRGRATQARFRETHPDNDREYIANRWRTPEGRIAMEAAYQRYRDSHPEINAINCGRRLARKAGLPDTLTVIEWQNIKTRFNHRCAYCGEQPEKLVQEHVIPLTQQGGTTAENIVPACAPCNSKKGPRTPEQARMPNPYQQPEVTHGT